MSEIRVDNCVAKSVVYPRRPKFQCEFCKYYFNGPKSFENHICPGKQVEEIVSPPEWANTSQSGIFQCEFCKINFQDRESLNIHICPLKPKEKINYRMGIVDAKLVVQTSGTQNKVRRNSFYVPKIGWVQELRNEDFHRPKCKVCGKAVSRTKMKLHIRTAHTDEKPYKCEICGIQFARSYVLGRHMKLHGGDYYVCPKCPFKSKIKNYTRQHVKERHFEIQNFIFQATHTFLCEKCPFKTLDQQRLARHVERMHSWEKSACVSASSGTGTTEGVVTFQCIICGFKVNGEEKLVREHFALKHKDIIRLPRQICRRKTGKRRVTLDTTPRRSSRESINQPQAQNVIQNPPVASVVPESIECGDEEDSDEDICRPKCKICGVPISRSKMKLHVRTAHTDEKPYSCEICGSRFARSYVFQRHMQGHGGHYFICPKCPFKSKIKNYTRRHMREHHFELQKFIFQENIFSFDFLCEKCPFKAYEKEQLTRHIERKHIEMESACGSASSGIRDGTQASEEIETFECTICGFKVYEEERLVREHFTINHADILGLPHRRTPKTSNKITTLRKQNSRKELTSPLSPTQYSSDGELSLAKRCPTPTQVSALEKSPILGSIQIINIPDSKNVPQFSPDITEVKRRITPRATYSRSCRKQIITSAVQPFSEILNDRIPENCANEQGVSQLLTGDPEEFDEQAVDGSSTDTGEENCAEGSMAMLLPEKVEVKLEEADCNNSRQEHKVVESPLEEVSFPELEHYSAEADTCTKKKDPRLSPDITDNKIERSPKSRCRYGSSSRKQNIISRFDPQDTLSDIRNAIITEISSNEREISQLSSENLKKCNKQAIDGSSTDTGEENCPERFMAILLPEKVEAVLKEPDCSSRQEHKQIECPMNEESFQELAHHSAEAATCAKKNYRPLSPDITEIERRNHTPRAMYGRSRRKQDIIPRIDPADAVSGIPNEKITGNSPNEEHIIQLSSEDPQEFDEQALAGSFDMVEEDCVDGFMAMLFPEKVLEEPECSSGLVHKEIECPLKDGSFKEFEHYSTESSIDVVTKIEVYSPEIPEIGSELEKNPVVDKANSMDLSVVGTEHNQTVTIKSEGIEMELTNAKSFPCKFCIESFSENNLLLSHILSHQGEYFVCPTCSFKTKTQDVLSKHVNIMHPEVAKFMCSTNDDLRSSEDDVKASTFNCFKCSFTTSEKEYLSLHLKRKHPGESQSGSVEPLPEKNKAKNVPGESVDAVDGVARFKCSICRVFKAFQEEGIREHVKISHPEVLESVSTKSQASHRNDNDRMLGLPLLERPLEAMSPNRFKRPSSVAKEALDTQSRDPIGKNSGSCLENQRREQETFPRSLSRASSQTKEGIPANNCSFNEEMAPNDQNMNKKMEGKEDQAVSRCYGLHKCTVCGLKFHKLGWLKLHVSKHEKIKSKTPFSCDLCNQHFITSFGIAKHMETHRGKYYVCPKCSYKSDDKIIMTRHIKIWHPDKFKFIAPEPSTARNTASETSSAKNSDDDTLTIQCLFCPFTTPYEQYIRQHFIKSHPQIVNLVRPESLPATSIDRVNAHSNESELAVLVSSEVPSRINSRLLTAPHQDEKGTNNNSHVQSEHTLNPQNRRPGHWIRNQFRRATPQTAFNCPKCAFQAFGIDYLIVHITKNHPQLKLVSSISPPEGTTRPVSIIYPQPLAKSTTETLTTISHSNEEEILGLPSPEFPPPRPIPAVLKPEQEPVTINFFTFNHEDKIMFAIIPENDSPYPCKKCKFLCKSEVELCDHYSRCHKLPTVRLENLKLQQGDVVLVDEY